MSETTALIVDWLGASLDPSRAHVITEGQAWHGRFMVFAWAICAPLGILIARYLKITPRQDWPRELDNRFWWRSHLVLQNGAAFLTVVGLAIIVFVEGGAKGATLHAAVGWWVAAAAAIQIASGFLRGTKGGPTKPAADGSLDGDHYSMTLRRKIFEYVHKSLGYGLLLCGGATAFSGLWLVNAPRWMALTILGYWMALTVVAAIARARLPRRTTYEAIWGPDPSLPGNRRGRG